MPPAIDEKTSVPLKFVLALLGLGLPLFGAAFYIGVEVHAIRVLMQSAWTVHDQDRWGAEAMVLNPTVKLPDAYSIVSRRKAAGAPN